MLAFQTTTPARIQCRRPTLLKTWHIATLAPGFDPSRLQFPIRVITDDSSNKILVSSQEELDTLLARYRDDGSQKPAILPLLLQRSDSVIGSLKLNPQLYRTDIDGISIISSSSSSSAATATATASSETFVVREYDASLSEHFVNGEVVCTGGLGLETRDLTQIDDEAGDVVFTRGRSVSMVVRRRYRKKPTRVQKVKKLVSGFFKHVRGLRWSA